MRPARALRIAGLAAVASLVPAGIVLAPACLDVTPITVPPRDAGSFEAGCTACLELPPEEHGCKDVLDGCRGVPSCSGVLACVEGLSCLDAPTIDDKINCGLPCLIDAGITSVSDPRVQALLTVITCGRKQCPMCNFGDAGGLGSDAL